MVILFASFNSSTESPFILTRFVKYVAAGGSTQTACAVRGAGHHGSGQRKSLRRHMWRDRKWKNHPSPSVSV